MSITSRYLEAALIDQVVAGTFSGKPYAFVTAYESDGLKLGVAVANESGYSPINHAFKDAAEAKEWVDGLNAHIHLTPDQVSRIVVSTMGGRSYAA